MSNFPVKLDQLLDLKIERLSFGGSGVAHHDGIVIFVPFSAPDDLVRAKITKIKKRHAEAEIIEILSASSARTKPPCPVYGICGGCNWQHLKYSEQIAAKDFIVNGFLKKFYSSDTQILPLQKSPKEFNYRNRAVLKFQNHQLGFYKKNSHEIVAIESCYLLEDELNNDLSNLKKNIEKQEFSSDKPVNVGIFLSANEKVKTSLDEDFMDGDGFSQVNRFQNKILIETIVSIFSENKDSGRIFDLYAGSGNFSFPFIEAKLKNQIIAVELHPGACLVFKNKLKSNSISPKHAQIYNSDVGLFLRRFPILPTDKVLLDPPRTGCDDEVLRRLAFSKPEKIVYISCDPSALSRDLERFLQYSENYYHINKIQSFDMFPQTHHIETVVEIIKKIP